MTRYAIIKDGVTVNVIEATTEFAASIGAVPAPEAGIGDLYAKGKFTRPEPAPFAVKSPAQALAEKLGLTDDELKELAKVVRESDGGKA